MNEKLKTMHLFAGAGGGLLADLIYRTHRLKAIGNGQVPLQAAVAWKLLGGP